ncbi:MAG: exodeoxyribonuclease VII small subunit [Planctomycetaceae bacterium]
MAKKTSRQDVPATPDFEQSLAELQQIVETLEAGTLGLNESLRQFERAVTLLRGCYGLLEQAEQKIELLAGLDEAGNATLVPFDAAATFRDAESAAGPRAGNSGADETDDEESNPSRLF